jgi:hypothetical protein
MFEQSTNEKVPSTYIKVESTCIKNVSTFLDCAATNDFKALTNCTTVRPV